MRVEHLKKEPNSDEPKETRTDRQTLAKSR